MAAIEKELKDTYPDWRLALAEWARQTGASTAPPWTVLHTQQRNLKGQKFEFLEDGSIVSRGYGPPREQNDFFVDLGSIDSLTPNGSPVSAVRLELLNHPELPRGGPGRSAYGASSLSEFKLAYVDPNGKEQSLPIASATANLGVDREPIDEQFADRRSKAEERTEGPIEDTIDGDLKAAWTTDTDAWRRNQPCEAVFVLKTPWAVPRSGRLIFKLNQSHGGKYGDQRHTNVAGRFRFSVTAADGPTADPLPAAVRAFVSRDPED
ncbi:MAG: hypothetical protein AAGJ46_03465 [Planctomycetota bacterium]